MDEKLIILQAIMGSIAYGLDTPESDEDLRSVYVAPTWQVLGLRKPVETIQKTDPDIVLQEVEKFISLALSNNPTILEMLFLDEYRILTEDGKLLVDNRDAFLSRRAFKTFGGYAIQQIRRLERRGDGSFSSDTRKRTAKHARHCFRLLQQGRELLETGHITVRVSNRDELFALGDMSVEDLVSKFEDEFAVFDKVESVLPEKPNEELANEILLEIRSHHLTERSGLMV